MNTKSHAAFRWLCGLAALAVGFSTATAEPINVDPKQPLPRPDDKTPDATKKVKVFILMGQSNMVGMGDIGPGTNKGTLVYLTGTEKKYPFLVDDAGQWTVCKDVHYYDARVKKGSPLSPTSNNGKSIGPELEPHQPHQPKRHPSARPAGRAHGIDLRGAITYPAALPGAFRFRRNRQVGKDRP